MLIDTHAHLQWSSFKKDLEKVIDKAKKVNVKKIVNIGFDLNGSKSAVKMAEKYDGLYATVGFHPHNALKFNKEILKDLRNISRNNKVVAIGEIGLDYFRDLSPRNIQKEVFKTQLLLAEDLNLPVIVHNRDANEDTYNMLLPFKDRVTVVMHCFSGSKEMAKRYQKLNFYLSFAGPVTFTNAKNLREVAKCVDLDKILIETDCPWLAPQAFRGKRNEPSFLPLIAEKIAELKNISFNELTNKTTKNANKIFRF